MKKINVALLSGGISSEREVSLKSGDGVFESLDKNKYNVMRFDPKTDIPQIIAKKSEIDVALIIMHGPYGEDGTIQGLLDLLKIPYQGSGVLGSSIAMDKLVSKILYKDAGLDVPPYEVIKKNEPVNSKKIIENLNLPLVFKPLRGGSSIGMSIIYNESDFEKAVETCFKYDDKILIEAYITGQEITCGVLGNNELQTFPLIEIIPNKEFTFFDYKAKYTPGATKEICPAPIDDKTTKSAQEIAIKAHETLCCKGYSRTDMIIKDERIYVLETNTIPGMTPTSLLPQAADAAGLDFSALLDRLIDLAME